MKADLYVQGHFWATIDLPADGLLAILAKGMITEAQQRAHQLEADLNAIGGVVCNISVRYHQPAISPPGDPDQHLAQVAP